MLFKYLQYLVVCHGMPGFAMYCKTWYNWFWFIFVSSHRTDDGSSDLSVHHTQWALFLKHSMQRFNLNLVIFMSVGTKSARCMFFESDVGLSYFPLTQFFTIRNIVLVDGKGCHLDQLYFLLLPVDRDIAALQHLWIRLSSLIDPRGTPRKRDYFLNLYCPCFSNTVKCMYNINNKNGYTVCNNN